MQNTSKEQSETIAKLEKKGFRFSNWLNEGDAMLIKKKGAMRYYAEVAIDGTVNGESVEAFLSR